MTATAIFTSSTLWVQIFALAAAVILVALAVKDVMDKALPAAAMHVALALIALAVMLVPPAQSSL